MSKGIIYYTDNRLDQQIESVVQKYILMSGLEIVSCSLVPMSFGDTNVVIHREPSFITYMTQIKTALEYSKDDYVFFCEHDVLYPQCHFDFTPPRDDVFYYNENVWRWLYKSNFAITYDRLISLSGLCVNRELALRHYTKRLETVEKMGEMNNTSREPDWARVWGYEPGTKTKKRGGFSNDKFKTWRSERPMVDIRHKGCLSKIKVTLDSFKHQPTNWQEINSDKIPGWKLKELFP